MRFPTFVSTVTLSYYAATTLWLALPVESFAQVQPQTISTVTLQVVPGQEGRQSVITPKGMVVPLPGAGVNSSAVQIYMGSQGGFWYVDRNGQSVDLTEPVHRLMAMQGQAAPQTMPVPQYAPPVQNVYQQAPASSYGNPMGTAAAAGLGAMAGSAISNSNNMPYGTPMYYHPNGNAYYNGTNGNEVTVNQNPTYNKSGYASMQQQQEWYAHQQQANPAQYQSWQQAANQNPFVNQASGYPNSAAAANQYNSNQQQQQANQQKAEQQASQYHNTQEQQQQANQQKAEQYHGSQQQQQQANQQKAEQYKGQQAGQQGEESGRRGRFRRGGADSSQGSGAEAKAAEDSGKREGRFRRGGDDSSQAKGAEASVDKADGGGRRGRKAGGDDDAGRRLRR